MAFVTRTEAKVFFVNQAIPTQTGFHNTLDSQPFRDVNGLVNMDGDTTTSGVKITRVDIGDWDMDTTSAVTISMPTTPSDFRNPDSWIVSIIPNNSIGKTDLNNINLTTGLGDGRSAIDTNGDIVLSRRAGAGYDNTSYNATSFNRGFITIFSFGTVVP